MLQVKMKIFFSKYKYFIGEKPYKCEHCPKTFARGGQLTQHLVTHTGLKKFKCDYCGQKFSSAANLRLHQKTHLDERDFTCHLCGKVSIYCLWKETCKKNNFFFTFHRDSIVLMH